MKTISQTAVKLPSGAEVKLPSLIFCIVMDIIGTLSFSIPFIGEFSDVIWAPLSAFVFMRTFGGRIGKFGSMLNFLEEALPFTDFIPSFTIAYFIRKSSMEKFLPLR